jgi:DNA-binding transcriptional LysR family regulator
METDYLKEFLVFGETLNYTLAAKRLYMAQPTLSSHIASLERTVGASLVEKGDGFLRLTPAGKYLLSEAYSVVHSIDSMVEVCRHINSTVISLNARIDTSYFDYTIDKARAVYRQRHPDGKVILNVVATPNGRRTALLRGQIDFDIGGALNLSEAGSLDVCSLKMGFQENGSVKCFLQSVDPMMFWITNVNPLFTKTRVSINDLQGATILMPTGDATCLLGEQIENAFKTLDTQVNIAYRPFSSLQEYYMSELGEAFGVTSHRNLHGPGFYEPNASRRGFTVEGVNLHIETYTVYLPDLLSKRKLEFIDILRELSSKDVSN